MPSDWDASIKLLYPVDQGTFFTIDDVKSGAPFDVIADVEIGQDLNQTVNSYTMRVGIVNLTTGQSVKIVQPAPTPLNAVPSPFTDRVRVSIPQPWTADVGDVLQAVASFTVTAGANKDYSAATSVDFIVS